MAQKTVLILEDEAPMRQALTGLQDKGFKTIVAATADAARSAARSAADIDVVVLDIRLGDGLIENGFDFGLQLKNERNEWPPEFLIHSAYEDVDYFQAALKLEVVAYLKKGGIASVTLPRVDVVAQHVRALALRRSLRSPEMAGRLQNIAAKSASRDEAIERFCGEVLSEELEATLGRDYILLLTRGEKTVAFSGRPMEHFPHTALQQLQGAVHARLGNTEPFIVSRATTLLPPANGREALQRVSLPIEGAAFIELGEIKSARLSLGLLPGEHSPQTVKEQVKLLDRYLQKPVIAHLLEVAERWAELDLERRFEAQKRKVLLEATSNFCLYQAEEIGYALQYSPEDKENGLGLADQVNKLKAIGAEMRDAGEILAYFAHSNEPLHNEPDVDMARLVERVWSDEVSPFLRLSQPGILKVAGQCFASDRPERAERAVSQILGWMGRRLTRARAEGVSLFVKCLSADGGKRVQVIFEEHSSRRLPQGLRESFFEPFYTRFASEPGDEIVDGGRRLGLYLAKTLAGLAGGELEDRSDELTGGLGHRFVLELPAAASDVA